MTLDTVQEDDGDIFFGLGGRRRAGLLQGFTHNEAPRPDRAARRATMDKASRAKRAKAPSPPLQSFRRCPCRQADATGNKARAKTVRYSSATTKIAGSTRY